MLEELSIKNLGLIRSLSIRFSPGLNLITGETGAGKTMLVHALTLIGGIRASSEWVGSEGNETWVEARFTGDLTAFKRLLEEAGIEASEEELIIKRIISRDGRSRAYLNGSMVSLQTLSRFVPYLITISGQFENQRLLRPENHLIMLDEFLDLTGLRERLNRQIEIHDATQKEIEALKVKVENYMREQALLDLALEEIEKAQIRPEEEQELVQERERLRHATEIKTSLTEALRALDLERESAQEKIAYAIKTLGKVLTYEPRLSTYLEGLEALRNQIVDLCWEIKRLDSQITVDPVRLDFVLERLDLINRLKKKYGGSIEALLKQREEIIDKRAHLEELQYGLRKLEEKRVQEEKAAMAIAEELSNKRQTGANQFKLLLETQLRELNMPHCLFKISFKRKDRKGGPALAWLKDGLEEVEFLISPNPGEVPRPLAKIASGGELSRITLALKVVLSQTQEVETVVFDEVDQGISGLTAELVGKKVKDLSQRQQVICITHLPQIAAQPGEHFVVEKLIEGERTLTKIRRLGQEERVEELSRMMGGAEITPTLLLRAKEMLELSAKES